MQRIVKVWGPWCAVVLMAACSGGGTLGPQQLRLRRGDVTEVLLSAVHEGDQRPTRISAEFTPGDLKLQGSADLDVLGSIGLRIEVPYEVLEGTEGELRLRVEWSDGSVEERYPLKIERSGGSLDPGFGARGVRAFPLPELADQQLGSCWQTLLPDGTRFQARSGRDISAEGPAREPDVVVTNAETLATRTSPLFPGTLGKLYRCTGTVDRDGAVIVVGLDSLSETQWRVRITRFRPDGSPDAVFGVNGVATFDITGTSHWMSVSVQAMTDGGALVYGGNGTSPYFLARLDAYGRFDGRFSATGPVFPEPSVPRSLLRAIAIDLTGTLWGVVETETALVLRRFSSNGLADYSFAGYRDEVLLPRTFLGGEGWEDVRLASLGNDRWLIVAETAAYNALPTLLVMHRHALGWTSPTIPPPGRILLPEFNVADLVSIDAGRWLLVGTVRGPGSNTAAAAAVRLLKDGPLDTSYGEEGVLHFRPPEALRSCQNLGWSLARAAPLPDGTQLGLMSSTCKPASGVVRLLP